jgi:formylglycine-generating enzyme required for sulfatase activity
MRALGIVFVLLTGACSNNQCNPGTVLLKYTLSGGAEAANTIDVVLAIGGAAARTMTIHRKTSASSGSIEVEFGTYPKAQSLAFTLFARKDDTVLGSASATTMAMPSCTALLLKLSGNAGGAPDLDLTAPLDMTLPADMEFVPGPNSPSCQGLAASCGAGLNDTCCTSPVVSGGTVFRGYDVATDNMYSDMTHSAIVSDFRLDKYEITLGRFRAFVAAQKGTRANPPAPGTGAHPQIAASGWDSGWNVNLAPDTASLVTALNCDGAVWTDRPGPNEDRPIGCITWFEAFAFCAWDEGFLPTDAEWQYAASGGSDQRAFPWSSPPASTMINDSYAVFQNAQSATRNVGTTPNGDGRWGQSDLAGNVWEWVLDWYVDYPNSCVDCAALTGGTERTFRGGGFENTSSVLRAANRLGTHDPPTQRNPDVGARCAHRR